MNWWLKFILIVLLFCGIPVIGNSQSLCQGNLGENIFEAGDFGSGAANVLWPDPGIAPGYNYTVNVPPQDGFYTITNSTLPWGNLWESWLRIEDNSPDPNGYMMVINASFSAGIFFEQTITGLCPETDYEFSADIINLIRGGVGDHILPDVSFLLNNEVQFTTGTISQTDSWNTYGFTFFTLPLQTEMTLTLRNNAPGGIGNDLALDNISFRACGPSAFINTDQTIFLCADENEPAEIIADLDFNTHVIQWQHSSDGGTSWEDIPGETDPFYFSQYLFTRKLSLSLSFSYFDYKFAEFQMPDYFGCYYN